MIGIETRKCSSSGVSQARRLPPHVQAIAAYRADRPDHAHPSGTDIGWSPAFAVFVEQGELRDKQYLSYYTWALLRLPVMYCKIAMAVKEAVSALKIRLPSETTSYPVDAAISISCLLNPPSGPTKNITDLIEELPEKTFSRVRMFSFSQKIIFL